MSDVRQKTGMLKREAQLTAAGNRKLRYPQSLCPEEGVRGVLKTALTVSQVAAIVDNLATDSAGGHRVCHKIDVFLRSRCRTLLPSDTQACH